MGMDRVYSVESGLMKDGDRWSTFKLERQNWQQGVRYDSIRLAVNSGAVVFMHKCP